MAKTILSVGFEVPGGGAEYVHPLSDRSLLDADIVVFRPGITSFTNVYENYLGKPCLSDDASFRVRESLASESGTRGCSGGGKANRAAARRAGGGQCGDWRKTAFGDMAATRTTRIIQKLDAYRAVPIRWQYHAVTGTEMTLVSEAFFAPYWSEFERYSQYRLYLDGEFKEPLVKTKTGGRVSAPASGRDAARCLLYPR